MSPETTYFYRVRAAQQQTFSPYSNEATATTPAQLPPAPTLQATAPSSSQIRLTWTRTATGIVRFHLERRIAAGSYAEINQPSPTATSFDDGGLSASTAYFYRIRVENGAGLSAYSNEATATTPAQLPTAPPLQAAPLSSSQIRLTWTTTATGVVRFHIERRITAGSYTEINLPGPTARGFDDSWLTASTVYFYRMRVEIAAGLSPYSNDVTATTAQGLPAPPTNLNATAASPTQINLTWTNSATDSTAVRMESRPAGMASFTDIGAAATLTSGAVINLQPNTSYTFRVRAQNSIGFSGYSNEVAVTTPAAPITVVLIHGIGQSGGAMEPLARTLRQVLPSQQFAVVADFNWGRCANPPGLFCPADCTLEQGANDLREYLNLNVPSGDIVLVGYSMGGLIARQLLMTTQFKSHKPIALCPFGKAA